MESSSIDDRDVGPLTVGNFPQEIYQEYEQRHQIIESATSYLQESSIIAQGTSQDRIGITYDQIAIHNGDVGHNKLFSETAPPENFSTHPLFQTNAIMRSFGPQESQEEDIEKINLITQSRANDDPVQDEANTLKSCLEEVAQLNNIMTEVKNQVYRLAKG